MNNLLFVLAACRNVPSRLNTRGPRAGQAPAVPMVGAEGPQVLALTAQHHSSSPFSSAFHSCVKLGVGMGSTSYG